MKKKEKPLPFNPLGQVDDQDKAHTPDKLRNPDSCGKDRDMPDEPRGRDHAEPSDYERPAPGAPERGG